MNENMVEVTVLRIVHRKFSGLRASTVAPCHNASTRMAILGDGVTKTVINDYTHMIGTILLSARSKPVNTRAKLRRYVTSTDPDGIAATNVFASTAFQFNQSGGQQLLDGRILFPFSPLVRLFLF